MKDFKSYSNGQNGAGGQNANAAYGAKQGENAACDANRRTTDGVEQTVNMATTLAKAFNGKSEGQILQTIIAQAEQGKRDGTLTNEDLDNFYRALSPLLDGFKKKKLGQIINKLKAL